MTMNTFVERLDNTPSSVDLPIPKEYFKYLNTATLRDDLTINRISSSVTNNPRILQYNPNAVCTKL